jgi:small subunit ribosomal protein S20
MANHPSAIKRMRQSEQKRLRNASYKSRVKSAVKRYLSAVQSKDTGAVQFLRQASSLLQKGISKGIYHKNTASRAISRLAGKLPRA